MVIDYLSHLSVYELLQSLQQALLYIASKKFLDSKVNDLLGPKTYKEIEINTTQEVSQEKII